MDTAVRYFTARGDEVVSETGTVVARVEYFGWARRPMRIFVGSKSYRSHSFWHPRTFQETVLVAGAGFEPATFGL
jgi:hypothetical protein